jgi:hypothetical protein
MRYLPGKTAVIIDHVGNYSRFGLPDTHRTWDLTPKKKADSTPPEVQVRQCPNCFACHEPAPVCPHCGFVYPVKARTIEEKREARLEKITAKVETFENPDQCKTMQELYAYAKLKGYKPGYAYFQGKKRGLL